MVEEQGSDQLLSEQLFLPHHVRIMKIALALAILRQKPNGVSAREFTERLLLQFSQLQTDWKSRAEQLERELLRTRQDLIKFQINSEVSSVTNPFPQDLYHPPPPAGYATVTSFSFNPLLSDSSDVNPLCSQPPRLPLSQLQHDNIFHQNSQIFENSSSQDSEIEWQSSGYSSSFSIQKENQSKTLYSSTTSSDLERTKYDTLVAERTAGNEVSSKENEKKEEECEDDRSKGDSVLQERITAHVKFCTSVTSLVSARHHLSTLVATDLRETLHDTILDAVKALTASLDSSNDHLTSSLPLSKKTLDESMASLVDSIHNPMMGVFKEEMCTACVTLVKAIIHKALQPTTNMDTIEGLSGMAVKLCVIPGVCQCAVEELVQQVVSSANLLEEALSDCSLLSPECIDAAAVQFRLLENLLTCYDISTIISKDKRQQMIQNLENSVLKLSETFPLFLYSVWKLIAYLS